MLFAILSAFAQWKLHTLLFLLSLLLLLLLLVVAVAVAVDVDVDATWKQQVLNKYQMSRCID